MPIAISTGNIVGSNPLPSGTPSPELGAGPGLVLAATVSQKKLVTTNSSIVRLTILLNYTSSYVSMVASLLHRA
jgi:hypothetical protein